MFTGIVEEKGTVKRITSGSSECSIELYAKKVLEGTQIGDSIAVNGVCLTVTAMGHDWFRADVMPETIRRSSLGDLKPGSKADLERAMAAGGRFGGHIVSGHIDGTGVIKELRHEGNAVWVRIMTPQSILRLIVEKGSITIDGISLTVAGLGNDYFEVSVIPHTASETVLLDKKVGDRVNLENDIVGKYVERLMSAYNPNGKAAGAGDVNSSNAESTSGTGGITLEFLEKYGF